MITTLITPRFIGRRLKQSDYADFGRLQRDPRVRRQLALDSHALPEEQTRDDFAALLAHWDREGFGAWSWHARHDGRFIGIGGLQRYGTDGIEIAYAALSDEWGQGFATEIGSAIIDEAFGTLRLAEIVCFILPTNSASRQIMQTLGFAYDSARLHAGLPHIFYRLSREKWSASHQYRDESGSDRLPNLPNSVVPQ